MTLDLPSRSNVCDTMNYQHEVQPAQPVMNDDSSSRWCQYQLWRHQHQMYMNGKSGKELGEEKKEDGELWCNVEAQAAFLGPNIWEKTLPYDGDLKYVDLDEFLSENGIPVDSQQPKQGSPAPGPGPHLPVPAGPVHPPPGSGEMTKRERSPSPIEPLTPATLGPSSPGDTKYAPLTPPSTPGNVHQFRSHPKNSSSFDVVVDFLSADLSLGSQGPDFDPRTRSFSEEELKPQPLVKKSRKQQWCGMSEDVQMDIVEFQQATSSAQFVPEDMKDEKYWARRRKNNMAAKRSRDARRLKENQIALRAGFLEKENLVLKQELDRLKKENMILRDKLSKFQEV